jgi:hypothetical protein
VSHGLGFGKARLPLLARDDGVQEVVGFDHFQVVVAQVETPGRVEVVAIRVGRPAQKPRVAILGRILAINDPARFEYTMRAVGKLHQGAGG